MKNLPVLSHSCMLVSWDKVSISFASALFLFLFTFWSSSFLFLNSFSLVHPFLSGTPAHSCGRDGEALRWSFYTQHLQGSFLEPGEVRGSSAAEADGLSSSTHWGLSMGVEPMCMISTHGLYTLLSVLAFHSWYPQIFSFSLDGQGWELRCPFQWNTLTF